MMTKTFGTGWRLVRNAVLIAIGIVAGIIGVAGLMLPIMPGIPLLILAGICFSAVS